MRTLTSLLALLGAAWLVQCQTADRNDYVFGNETGGAGIGTGGRGSPSPSGGAPGAGGRGASPAGSRPVGEECSANTDCANLRCIDGVCCDRSCANCDACRFTLTGKSDGTCAPVLAGQDPHETCDDETAKNECGNDGTCDGSGACRKVGASHVCTVSLCSGNSFVPATTCDGHGACSTSSPEACGASPCTSSGCQKSCSVHSDCGSSSYCRQSGSGGTCTTKKPSGTAAEQAFECLSNVVADGVCCDRACTDCQACSGAPLTAAPKGQCANVVRGQIAHEACERSDDDCGLDGNCDGLGACAYKTAACDDGDGCTQDDVCRTGVCRGIARTCEAAPPCKRNTTCSEGTCDYSENVPDGVIESKCPVLEPRCFQGRCVRCVSDEDCGATQTCDPATGTCITA